MKLDYFHDTIVAEASPSGVGAISIVRLSGDKTFEITNNIFYSSNKNSFENIPDRYMQLVIFKNINNNSNIDEVLFVKYSKPNSYTGENMIEIFCHGSPFIVQQIISEIINLGARYAEPGEFTRRAYLNNKIDLIQAEAVQDIICSNSIIQLESSLFNLKKRLSKSINKIAERLKNLLSHIEVLIDYPEEDIQEIEVNKFIHTIKKTKKELNLLLKKAHEIEPYFNVPKILILGKTNVGKSSLFNQLLSYERAIVSSIPGTTRDYLEGFINLDDRRIQIIDTAGIRETDDALEYEGTKKALNLVKTSDLVVLVFDNNQVIPKEDLELFNKELLNNNVLVVINKTDLPQLINEKELLEYFINNTIIRTSIYDKNKIEVLKTAISEYFKQQKAISSDNLFYINKRQLNTIKHVKKCLNDLNNVILNDEPMEFWSIELRNILNLIGEITGEITSEDILNNIFSNFCVGK